MTKYTVFWWERRIGEGLLSERFFSVSTWRGLQFQRSFSFIDTWLSQRVLTVPNADVGY